MFPSLFLSSRQALQGLSESPHGQNCQSSQVGDGGVMSMLRSMLYGLRNILMHDSICED